MNKQHVTKGPVHIGVRQPNSDKFIYGANGTEIANCDRLTNFPDENQANAELIAEAFNVLHETGYTPAELADMLGEPMKELRECVKNRDAWQAKADRDAHPGRGFCSTQAMQWGRKVKEARATLSKHQPVTPA